jgi:hypothetical protein
MSTFPKSFLIGGTKHEAMAVFPEFRCEQMAEDFNEAFDDCALCFRTEGKALEPAYLLDMRFLHLNKKPDANFYVWSHPKNIFRVPFFKNQKFKF